MKVSELIETLGHQPPDRDVEIFLGGDPCVQRPIVGVGTLDPANGEPVKAVILAG